MQARTIELDDDASKILDSMTTAYDGNASLAIFAMLRTHEAWGRMASCGPIVNRPSVS